MKMNKFEFGVLLTLSVVTCAFSKKYATAEVGSSRDVVGTVFLIALPLIITKWREWTVEQERKEDKKTIQNLLRIIAKQEEELNRCLRIRKPTH